MITIYSKNNIQLDKAYVQHILEFVKFSCFILKCNFDINIYLLAKGQDNNSTTGGYDPLNKKILALYEGRALVDILRSIAHELEHQRQDSLKLLPVDQPPQNIGGFLENDANIIAGILIKLYVQNFGLRSLYSL